MAGPLSTLKIVEFAGLGPCPLAGQLLCDLGAEVIVIDRKAGVDISGDVNRRGKKSIVLDLKSQADVTAALSLIANADILIEGFRPGVMERLGLGPDKCLQQNEKLVYGRMTGWGQTGPLAHTAGHDLNYLAITGFLHAMGKRDEPPVPPLNFVADYGGGSMFLIMGVLAAIIERGISGKGQIVDAAMCEGVPAMMGLVQSMIAAGSWTKSREDNFVDGGAPYYRCYTCSDGKFLSVGCIEPQFFAEFLQLTNLSPDLATKQNNKNAWPALHAIFENKIYEKTRDEWTEIFHGSDACVAPVLNFDEAAAHPQSIARNTFFAPDDIQQTAPVPHLSRSIAQTPKMASTTGMHTQEILASLDKN